MKLREMLWFGLLLAGAAGAAATETVPLTFNAVLSVGKDKRFGLATDDARRSAWLPVGGEFEGFVLKSFDEPTQTLILERGGQTYRLPIADGGIQTLETKSRSTLADAADVMAKMRFDQMLERVIAQQKKALAGVSKQLMGSVAAQATPEETAALQGKIVDALWAQLKTEELKQEMTKVYSEVFSKEELRSMSQFYSSPAGLALLDKQPEIQDRLLSLMMPKMMQAMPEVARLQKQFAADHAADHAAKPASTSAK